MTAAPPRITALVNGREAGRAEVVAKEMRRAHHVLRKLGAPPVAGTPDIVRRAVLNRKLELGRDELRRMLAVETARAGRVASAFAIASRGKRRPSGIELAADGITAKEFTAWFHARVDADDEQAMLAAHPEHYIIHTTPTGQEVYETNGGSPLVAAFTIDFNDTADISIATVDGYPYQIVGVAVLPDGRRIGGVKHQFRDTETGLHALLAIDFPLFTAPTITRGHRWHLAIEFSNWIEAAAAARG